MGEVVLEPYMGGGAPVQKKGKLVTVLFVLLCGILLGWFIIIALFRGDIGPKPLTEEEIQNTLSKPSLVPPVRFNKTESEIAEDLSKPSKAQPINADSGKTEEEILNSLSKPSTIPPIIFYSQ